MAEKPTHQELENRIQELKQGKFEHQQEQKTLRASEENYRELVENAASIIMKWDRNGRILFLSEYGLKFFGYKKQEIIGKSLIGTIVPETEEGGRKLIKVINDIFKNPTRYEKNINENIRKDGSRIWVAWTNHPIYDDEGRVTDMFSVGMDITLRKQAEEALRENEEKLRAILDASPDVIHLLDINGIILSSNKGFTKRVGLEIDAVVGKSVFDFIPTRSIESSKAAIDKVFRTGNPVQLENIGLSGAFESQVHPVFDSGGEVRAVAVYARDITEFKRAEKALREGELKHRTIMDTSADPIVVYDNNGQVTYLNPAFTEIFGWEPEEVIGGRIDFVPDEAVAATQQAIETVSQNKNLTGFETRRFTKSGQVVDVLISAAMLRDESQAPVGIVVNFHNITAQKRTLAELESAKKNAEAANRAKSYFLANMSHEIRTPMNGIIGMTELVLDTDLTGDQRKFLEMAKMSADSLLALINDILDFSKIEAGKMELETIDFNLRVTLENATDTLALKAHEKGLELTCHILPDVPTALIGDPGKLRQVIVNIAGNSLKFTEEGEIVIRVALESESDDSVKLHFMVSDTGIGIPQDRLDSIFKSFEQVDGSTTRKYGGTGLGLSITRQLVEMMGGEIRVESPNRFRLEEDSNTRNREPRMGGPGSSFHFTVCFELSRSKEISISRSKPQDLSGVPVLIVDDNYTNRILLQEMITSWGLVPTIATNGKEALDRFNKAFVSGTPYRLILLDMQMPELDGFDVAKIIKDAPSGKDVRIILISSIGQKGDSDRCKEIGISGYLPKPIKQSDLFDAIMITMGLRSEEMPAVITRHKIYEARESLNILLAEDNLINQTLAIKLLETRGHRVTLATNGVEAVEAFIKGDFDLILMDIQMPKMDGFEATRIIRSLMFKKCDSKARMLEIPIIAMTAHAMTGDREKCIDAGMDDYVSKPIKPEALYSVISKVTRKSKSAKEQKRPQPSQRSKTFSPTAFDLSCAMETVLGDEDLFQEIAGMFIESCSDYIAKIKEGIAGNDAGILEREAHGLKGAVGNFAAKEAYEAAYRLEKLGNEGKMATAAEELLTLERALNELASEMKTVLQEMKKIKS